MTVTPPRIVVVTIRPPLQRSDLPGLVRRTCAVLASAGEVPIDLVCCDAAGVEADGVAVDALAQLALATRRRGCAARLSGASAELVDLVRFAGLAEVLGC
jgi:ABC-type transporter Mla MlaB component